MPMGALLLAVDGKNSVLKGTVTHSYSTYGFEDLTSKASLIGFNGEHRDGASGCDLLGRGRRAYSPVLMRFFSPDILSPFAEGGLNAYMYCGADPVNYWDPSAMMRGVTTAREKGHVNGRSQNGGKRSPLQNKAIDRGNKKSSGSSKVREKADASFSVGPEFWEALRKSEEATAYQIAEYMVDTYMAGPAAYGEGFPRFYLVSAIQYKIESPIHSMYGWSGVEKLVESGHYLNNKSAKESIGQYLKRMARYQKKILDSTAQSVNTVRAP
ncbi:RHS repeat-associated core domain-containing protein [Pseudomonas sp. SWRI50]|nr:RHS repeat-associated core domain-containing protein [Pseudomonas sp. SWRI50]